MVDDTERLVAEIPRELKLLVDSDRRTNKEVVEAALWTELGSQKQAAIDRRIEEKRRQKSNLVSERNERQREIEEIDEELQGLQELQAQTLSKKEQRQNAIINQVSVKSLASIDQPIIETNDEKLEQLAERGDMTVTELKTKAKQRFENEQGND